MFDMTAYAQLRVLLSELDKIEDSLMPNELEMLHSIKAKYTDPQSPDPFDSTALNVILRNVEVRKGVKMDVKKDSGRVINLPSADTVDED